MYFYARIFTTRNFFSDFFSDFVFSDFLVNFRFLKKLSFFEIRIFTSCFLTDSVFGFSEPTPPCFFFNFRFLGFFIF